MWVSVSLWVLHFVVVVLVRCGLPYVLDLMLLCWDQLFDFVCVISLVYSFGVGVGLFILGVCLVRGG